MLGPLIPDVFRVLALFLLLPTSNRMHVGALASAHVLVRAVLSGRLAPSLARVRAFMSGDESAHVRAPGSRLGHGRMYVQLT